MLFATKLIESSGNRILNVCDPDLLDTTVKDEKSTVKNSHVENTKETHPQIQQVNQPQAQAEMNEKKENSQTSMYDSDQSTQDWPNKENNVN